MPRTNSFTEHFMRDGVLPSAGDTGSIFVKALTNSAVVQCIGSTAGAAGVLSVALASSNEAENGCAYNGDKLFFPVAKLKRVEFRACLSVALGSTAATTQVAFGLASARNATIDSIATNALFRVLGDAAGVVTCETDDGTTDTDDVSTGETLTTSFKNFVIDFEKGLSDVRFYMDGSNGLKRVCPAQTFSMAAATSAYVQFFAQIQKAANTDVGTLLIDRFSVDWKE